MLVAGGTDGGRRRLNAPGVGVSAIVVDGDKVLLVRRGRPPAKGAWSFPGGRLELGETLRDAVRRELFEECGLRIAVGPIVDVVEMIGVEEGETVHWVVVDYLARAVAGRARAGDDAAELRWAALGELEELATTPRVPELAAAALALAASGHDIDWRL